MMSVKRGAVMTHLTNLFYLSYVTSSDSQMDHTLDCPLKTRRLGLTIVLCQRSCQRSGESWMTSYVLTPDFAGWTAFTNKVTHV